MRFPFIPRIPKPDKLASADEIYRDQRALLNWLARVLVLGVIATCGLASWLIIDRWLAERAAPVNAVAHEAQQRIYLSTLMLRRISSAIDYALEETASIRDLPVPPGLRIDRDPQHGLERVLPQAKGIDYGMLFANGASLERREDLRWLRAVHRAVPAMGTLQLLRQTVAGTEIIRGDGRALTAVPAPERPEDWLDETRSSRVGSALAARHRELTEAVRLDAPAAWGQWSILAAPQDEPGATVYRHSLALEGQLPAESALIVNEIPAAALFSGADRSPDQDLSFFVFDSRGQQVTGPREVAPELVAAAQEQGGHRGTSFDLKAGEILISQPVADGLFTVVGGIHWTAALQQLSPRLGPTVALMLLLIAITHLGCRIVHDRVIAPRWRLAHELDRTRQLLDRVFDLSPVGLCIAEVGSSRVTRANAAALALLPELREGMQLHTHMSKTGWCLVEDTHPISSHIEQTIVRRDVAHEPEVLKILHSNADRQVAVVALVDLSKEHAMQVATELARTDAERSNAAMRNFIATVSHEIRTPLTGICGGLDLLERSPASAEAPRLIGAMRRSGAILKKSVDDLLDLSKIEAGRMEIARSKGRLRHEIGAIADLYREAAAAKGLDFHVRVSREVPAALSLDWMRIRQVLGNLIDNAIKFTAEGRIIVWAGMSGPCELELSVTDTGRGIPADELHRMFTPFTRIQEGGDRIIPGTGLGLSISRRLCELHGGRLDVSSIERVGSHFRALLPISAEEAATSPSDDSDEIPPAQAARQQALRVLLVEDDPTCRLVIAEQLKLLGADVVTADSAERAIAQLRDTNALSPDCVITDLGLPGIQGDELARALRAGQAGAALRHVPILGLTASAVPEHRSRCLESGMNAVLLKPFPMDDLRKILAKMDERAAGRGSDHAAEPSLDQLFLDTLREDMALVEHARRAGDWAAVGRRVHRIAGAAAVMGNRPLRLAALAVESAIHDGLGQHEDRLERLFATIAELIRLRRPSAAAAPV